MEEVRVEAAVPAKLVVVAVTAVEVERNRTFGAAVSFETDCSSACADGFAPRYLVQGLWVASACSTAEVVSSFSSRVAVAVAAVVVAAALVAAMAAVVVVEAASLAVEVGC